MTSLSNLIEIVAKGNFDNKSINDLSAQISGLAINGDIDPLGMFISCKAISKILENVIANIEPEVLNEALKYNSKVFEFHGATITIKELGTKYDYDACKDSVLQNIQRVKAQVSESEKKRQTFLKSLASKTNVVDEETGEMSELYPPIKTSKTGVIVTF